MQKIKFFPLKYSFYWPFFYHLHSAAWNSCITRHPSSTHSPLPWFSFWK